jgi:deoxycytidine triphosphate deaminase
MAETPQPPRPPTPPQPPQGPFTPVAPAFAPPSGAPSSSGQVEPPAAGGVLSDRAIAELVGRGELIVEGFDDDALQNASYNPRIAHDGLIAPKGRTIAPGSDDGLTAKVVLESGDAAMFSTTEMFAMPHDVAGNISIKNGQAVEGLMLLSGLLIDPGYGQDAGNGGTQGLRLYLHVANIGKEPVVIKPGDQIARIQFLSVSGGLGEQRQVDAPGWSGQEQPSLGFLTEMKELKEQVESTSTQVQNVVLLGFVVLGITLIGVSLSTILPLTLNTRLTRELRALWPHSTSGKIATALIALAVPLTLFAFCYLGYLVARLRAARRRNRR